MYNFKFKSDVPPNVEMEVDIMMRELNSVMRNLGGNPSREDCMGVYESDLLSRSMWNTKTARNYFPLSRFIKIVRGKHLIPEQGHMVVAADRRSWSCKFCTSFPGQDMRPDESGKCQRWHRQNCFKHFRSASHCQVIMEHVRETQSSTLQNALDRDKESDSSRF